MPAPFPALNLIAIPGRRRATLEVAREIERRGFAGISVSSSYANMAQCTGLALATERITRLLSQTVQGAVGNGFARFPEDGKKASDLLQAATRRSGSAVEPPSDA